MKIALCADEPYPVHGRIQAFLEKRGHEVACFGAPLDKKEHPWADVAAAAAEAVADGRADEGVFLCWTGTGICMAANKIPGIRAALCADPQTAAGARQWNHANVLCLSHRTLSDEMADEILTAWFDADIDARGEDGVARLDALDARTRRDNSLANP